MQTHMIKTLFTLLLFIASTAITSSHAFAQDDGDDKPPGEEKTEADTDNNADDDAEDKDDEEADEDKDEYLAIINGRVHTISGATLPSATILSKNGTIIEVGPDVLIPDGAEVIDASGHEVYPGLIAMQSSGILGGGSPDDSTDVFNLNMTVALAAGITTSVTGNDAAKLTYGTLDDMIVSRGLYQSINYSTRNPSGRRQLIADFERLRQYQRDVASYQEKKRRNPDAEAPDNKWIRGKYQNYMRMLKGEVIVRVDANDAQDLIELADLAETYGLRMVIRGAIEGWTVAPQLAKAGVSVIVSPRARRDVNDRLNRPNGSSIENAAILLEHGVPVAFRPVGSLFGSGDGISFGGLAGRDLLHLPMEAAFAVRGGMSNENAIKALTLDAARILDIDNHVGSIEPGKDADFVITDGDLLHYMTHARWTIVNGRIAYDKQKDTLFNHIRPDGNQDAPPPNDHWPRRLGEPWE